MECLENNEHCIRSRCVVLGQRCSSSDQCPFSPSTECYRSKCRAREFCYDDADCPKQPFHVCSDGRCIPTKGCHSDGDCAQNPPSVCIANRCVEKNKQYCQTANDCAMSSDCIDGVCGEAMGRRCHSDHECPTRPFSNCSNSVCVEVLTRQSCVHDSNCPATSICVQEQCFEREYHCQTDQQCPPKSYCNSGRCVPEATCMASNECQNKPCVDGICVRNVPNSCERNTDCPYYPKIQCIQYKCKNVHKSCFNDNHCPMSDQYACIRSYCAKFRRPCSSDSDCFAPKIVCKSGMCDRA
ncbi:unnamed protein product [Nippostrongylus brasiliensis]|uniref:Tenascin-X n=1 Tax=Nippostrongylus brasiliensis TaxID=27835 RepID=A0A0N4Y505_NIPBR|nr:unnamed protein product [Nippostrongylus brasiliensis]